MRKGGSCKLAFLAPPVGRRWRPFWVGEFSNRTMGNFRPELTKPCQRKTDGGKQSSHSKPEEFLAFVIFHDFAAELHGLPDGSGPVKGRRSACLARYRCGS